MITVPVDAGIKVIRNSEILVDLQGYSDSKQSVSTVMFATIIPFNGTLASPTL